MLLVKQFGLGKVVNFEVKIPSLFLVNPLVPAGTCFFTGVRCTLPGFGQRGRGRSPYFLSPQLKKTVLLCWDVKSKISRSVKFNMFQVRQSYVKSLLPVGLLRKVRRYTHGILWFRLQLFPWFNSFIFFPMCRIWYSTDWTGLLSPPFIWWSFVPWCWRRFVPCVPKIGIRTTRRTEDGIGCRDRIPFGDVILRGQLDNFNKNEGEKGEILDQLSESYYIDSYWF